MAVDMMDVATKLLNCGATPVLVQHMTKLKPATVNSILAEKAGIRLQPDQDALERFFETYGDFDNVTVDVLRFVKAIEVSRASPDAAFRSLRNAMLAKLQEQTPTAGSS